jgi:hypothetical protein
MGVNKGSFSAILFIFLHSIAQHNGSPNTIVLCVVLLSVAAPIRRVFRINLQRSLLKLFKLSLIVAMNEQHLAIFLALTGLGLSLAGSFELQPPGKSVVNGMTIFLFITDLLKLVESLWVRQGAFPRVYHL